MRALPPLLSLVALAATAPAHALCFYTKADFYAGKDRSYTTVPQEFRDAKWVVRAKVLSAVYHQADGRTDSWTLYRLRILQTLKGRPVTALRLFTYRDSGGFYLDKGNGPDLGTDYLLFLVPPSQTLPPGLGRVTQINFNCGQSKPWRETSAADRAWLAAHAKRRRPASPSM